MTRLPTLTSRKVLKALKSAGFTEHTQRGSHLSLKHPDRPGRVVLPMHSGDLPRGTVKAILEQAGLTEDELRRLL